MAGKGYSFGLINPTVMNTEYDGEDLPVQTKISEEADKAKDKATNLYDTEKNIDEENLYAGVNNNYAKDGGEYNSLNNKDFSNTLELVRRADLYNARSPLRTSFTKAGHKTEESWAEKPKLDTVEQRVFDQAVSLDTNQKQLAQTLQSTVKAKDYNAFKRWVEAISGINESQFSQQTEARLKLLFNKLSTMESLYSTNANAFSSTYPYAVLASAIATNNAADLYAIAAQNTGYYAPAIYHGFETQFKEGNPYE